MVRLRHQGMARWAFRPKAPMAFRIWSACGAEEGHLAPSGSKGQAEFKIWSACGAKKRHLWAFRSQRAGGINQNMEILQTLDHDQRLPARQHCTNESMEHFRYVEPRIISQNTLQKECNFSCIGLENTYRKMCNIVHQKCNISRQS